MKHTKKKMLSLLIALLMVLCLVPSAVFAADPEVPELSDGSYPVADLSITLGMWHIDDADFTSTVEV